MYQSKIAISEKLKKIASEMRLPITDEDNKVIIAASSLGAQRWFRNEILFNNYLQAVVQSLPSLTTTK